MIRSIQQNMILKPPRAEYRHSHVVRCGSPHHTLNQKSKCLKFEIMLNQHYAHHLTGKTNAVDANESYNHLPRLPYSSNVALCNVGIYFFVSFVCIRRHVIREYCTASFDLHSPWAAAIYRLSIISESWKRDAHKIEQTHEVCFLYIFLSSLLVWWPRSLYVFLSLRYPKTKILCVFLIFWL